MVALIVDTSVLVSAANTAEPDHKRCYATLTCAHSELVIAPMVLAESDYTLARLGNINAEIAMLRDVYTNMTVAAIGNNDLSEATALIEQYRDFNIGLTDAVNVLLAARYQTHVLLMLDHRHFRAITPLTRETHFTLLP